MSNSENTTTRQSDNCADKWQQHIDYHQRTIFGARYEGASLSKIRLPVAAQEILIKFLNKPTNFLIFCGSPGIGKTYFCAALIPFAIQTFKSFRYWNESELLKRVRSSMDEFKGDYLETLKYLIDDDFVMIDDIGSTGLNQWRKEIIFDAIDERYCSMKPTVITSNLSRKQFENEFHPRVASRLFANDNIILEIENGFDHRK